MLCIALHLVGMDMWICRLIDRAKYCFVLAISLMIFIMFILFIYLDLSGVIFYLKTASGGTDNVFIPML